MVARFLPVGLAAFLLALHSVLGWYMHAVRVEDEILPPLPSRAAVGALSFGDAQFLYRAFALQLQNAGDTGGRFTPMDKYNMPDVVAWLDTLQQMDPLSSYYTIMAVRYFSQAPARKTENLRLLVAFIDRDVAQTPQIKWYWQTQAVAIARDRIKDLPYALELSQRVRNYRQYVTAGFMWVIQMEPTLLADLGRTDEARAAMTEIVEKYGPMMNEPEQRWTNEFFQRLN